MTKISEITTIKSMWMITFKIFLNANRATATRLMDKVES